jgi:hypothetical protein
MIGAMAGGSSFLEACGVSKKLSSMTRQELLEKEMADRTNKLKVEKLIACLHSILNADKMRKSLIEELGEQKYQAIYSAMVKFDSASEQNENELHKAIQGGTP